MKHIALAASILLTASPATAASIAKTYSYFSIGGTTIDQLEMELFTRGPEVQSTGRRHPGATQMQFNTRTGYAEKNGYCRVAQARVTVSAKVILPRWRTRAKADEEVRTIWDTLSSDIKRHEEGHVVIAKNHARDLEEALLKLGREKSCEKLAEKVAKTTAKILEQHDRAQERFDRIESINFESRLLRLLKYRMERDAAAQARKK